jgi:hypothetical protein
MIATVLAASLMLGPHSTSRVTAASLFKNGYAVVMREIDVPAAGDVVLAELPQSALGTLWISATPGVQLTEVVKTSEPTTDQRDAANLDEVLTANVGKAVRIGISIDNVVTTQLPSRVVIGKLLSATGQVVLVQTEKETLAFNKGVINSVSNAQGDLAYKITTKGSMDVLRIKLGSNTPGKIFLIGLERGITWAPAYLVDISDANNLTLLAKATVLDDLTKLNDADLKFVTGFPNIPWLGFLDPLLSGHSVDQFDSMLSSVGLQPQNMMRNSQATGLNLKADEVAAAFNPTGAGGIQAEDLFFYMQPHVTLKKGDRAYYILFTAKSPYQHLYTLDLPDSVLNNVEYRPIPDSPPDVWHSLTFKNSSGQPLTTAPATVYKGGELMGQDTLNYSSVNGDVLLRMSKALDVHADQTEEELSRDRGSLRLPNNGTVYDLVKLKGTISLENFKKESVSMKITKELTGEVTTSDGAKVTKIAKGLQEVNPREHLVWTPKIGAGQKLLLTYTYQLYVRSG